MKSRFFSNHDLTPSHPKHLHTYHIPSLFVTSPKKMMRETTRNLRQSKHPIFPGEIPMMSFNPPFLIRENREIPPFFPGFSHPKPVKSHHFSWFFPVFFHFFVVFPWFSLVFSSQTSEIPVKSHVKSLSSGSMSEPSYFRGATPGLDSNGLGPPALFYGWFDFRSFWR